jgi:hypothetical protein
VFLCAPSWFKFLFPVAALIPIFSASKVIGLSEARVIYEKRQKIEACSIPFVRFARFAANEKPLLGKQLCLHSSRLVPYNLRLFQKLQFPERLLCPGACSAGDEVSAAGGLRDRLISESPFTGWGR